VKIAERSQVLTSTSEVAPLRGETRGETKERWRELCEQAVVEQDPDEFRATIQELLQVLDDREERRRNAKNDGAMRC
jgi:hypothetical protein